MGAALHLLRNPVKPVPTQMEKAPSQLVPSRCSALSLDDVLNVEVTVASLFKESELVDGASTSVRGLATSLDGVPLNVLSFSTALYNTPNFSSSLLDRIEMIRGAGSTIYGSDAFIGVLSQKTWNPTRAILMLLNRCAETLVPHATA